MDDSLLTRNASRGEKLEYWGDWNGMKVGVVLRVREDNPDYFVLSIVSPFFNVTKEIVSKDVIKEMDKVYNFLNRKPAEGNQP